MRSIWPCTLIATLVMTASADACRCRPSPPPAEALAAASAVLVGKVIKLERNDHGVLATIEVDRAWKGVTQKSVIIHTSQGTGADCGYPFQMGKSYLIYTNSPPPGEGEQAKLSTNTCTRTCPIDQAADDLKAIGEGKKVQDAK